MGLEVAVPGLDGPRPQTPVAVAVAVRGGTSGSGLQRPRSIEPPPPQRRGFRATLFQAIHAMPVMARFLAAHVETGQSVMGDADAPLTHWEAVARASRFTHIQARAACRPSSRTCDASLSPRPCAAYVAAAGRLVPRPS
jgi:hypothetical protein